MEFLSKNRLEDFTEQEFLQFLHEFFEDTTDLKGEALGAYLTQLTEHFESLVDHPNGSDLISIQSQESTIARRVFFRW